MGFEFEGGRQESVAVGSDAPAPRSADLGEQTVQAQGIEPAAPLGRQPAASNGTGGRTQAGHTWQVPTGEPVQGMFTAQDSGERRRFAFAQRVEPSGTTRTANDQFA